MTQYSWQPQAADVGTISAALTQYNTAGTPLNGSIVDTGGGVYALHYLGTTGSQQNGFYWTDAAGPGTFTDGEIYVRIRLLGTTVSRFGPVLRWGGTGSSTLFYTRYNARIVHNTTSGQTELKRQCFAGAATPVFDTKLYDVPNGQTNLDLHVCMRLQGTTLSLKAWKDGDTEPAYTDHETADVADAGYAGFLFQTSGEAYIYQMGVGTGTDAAPRTAVEPPPLGAIAFSGNVSNRTATVGTAYSLNLASYFSGSETPFTYALQAGTLPDGLTLTGSTISGTPTATGVSAGIVVRATDAALDTADTNAFSITVNAAAAGPTLTYVSADMPTPTSVFTTVQTNGVSGTLYTLLSENPSESVATVKASGSTQNVTTYGVFMATVPTTITGNRKYAHWVHTKDSADSAVATALVGPGLEGTITVTNITNVGYTPSWQAGHDDFGVSGYEYSINGGAWVDVGNVLTTVVTGRTPGATDNFAVRARDADGLYSAPALTVAVTLTNVAAVTTAALHSLSGTLHTNAAVHWTWWPAGRIGGMASVTPSDGTGTTDAQGQLGVPSVTPPGVLMVSVRGTDATDDAVYYEAFE